MAGGLNKYEGEREGIEKKYGLTILCIAVPDSEAGAVVGVGRELALLELVIAGAVDGGLDIGLFPLPRLARISKVHT